MEKYEQFDISGDVGLKIFGQTLNDIFTNAALGMYSLITDTGKIKEKRTIEIAVQSPSLESLFVSWLNELIFNFDTYGFIGIRIVIVSSEFGVRSFKTPDSELSTPNYALQA